MLTTRNFFFHYSSVILVLLECTELQFFCIHIFFYSLLRSSSPWWKFYFLRSKFLFAFSFIFFYLKIVPFKSLTNLLYLRRFIAKLCAFFHSSPTPYLYARYAEIFLFWRTHSFDAERKKRTRNLYENSSRTYTSRCKIRAINRNGGGGGKKENENSEKKRVI